MKRQLLTTLAIVIASFGARAQENFGYFGTNGYSNNLINPANLSGSKYELFLNLGQINANLNSNLIEFNTKKFFSFKYDNLTEGSDYNKINSNNSKFITANVDVLGPSLLISLSKKSAIGIYTRLRTMANLQNLSNNSYQLLTNPNPNFYNLNLNENNININVNSFAEFGVSYGGQIFKGLKNTLRWGTTLKYVMPIGATNVNIEKFSVINVKNADTIAAIQGNGSVNFTENSGNLLNGELTSAINELGNAKSAGNSALAVDFGLVYELQLNKNYNYAIKVGVSVTDFGISSLKYNNSIGAGSYSVNINNTSSAEFSLKGGESYSDYLNRLSSRRYINKTKSDSSFTMNLPTALQVFVDWHIKKHWYLNFYSVLNTIKPDLNTNVTNYITSYILTPRWESKWLTILSPICITDKNITNWGLGVQVGPLFVGSGSLISNLMQTTMKNTDFKLGLGLPLFRKNN